MRCVRPIVPASEGTPRATSLRSMARLGGGAQTGRAARARRSTLGLTGALGVASVVLALRAAVHGFWLDLAVFLVVFVSMVCLMVTLLRRRS